jgi:hypothetical protein
METLRLMQQRANNDIQLKQSSINKTKEYVVKGGIVIDLKFLLLLVI